MTVRVLPVDQGVHLRRRSAGEVQEGDDLARAEAQAHLLADARKLAKLPELERHATTTALVSNTRRRWSKLRTSYGFHHGGGGSHTPRHLWQQSRGVYSGSTQNEFSVNLHLISVLIK